MTFHISTARRLLRFQPGVSKPRSATTGGQVTPDLTPTEVYWIDRERVASADLMLLYAAHPSFGAGQEAEIAANAGVPILLLAPTGTPVSRMLRGIPGRLFEPLQFDTLEELSTKLTEFLQQHLRSLRAARQQRDREYQRRVGVRVQELRLARGFDKATLAEKADVHLEILDGLETRPEKLSNISIIHLRRIARALGVTAAELLHEQGESEEWKDQLVRQSLGAQREFAILQQLSYDNYAKLKAEGRRRLNATLTADAARNAPSSPLTKSLWFDIWTDIMRRAESLPAETSSFDD